ncbi:16S rRNA (adenine(1518)-N(6)/adenine(1519)-N(6))-dimethyltransferase RsmA [Chloroflexota bacterium]
MRRLGIQARKGLGQHFLVDESILELIISAAELTPADIVMEIGPGLGILTSSLVKKAGSVVAIELDDKLAGILNQTLSSFNNFTIVNEDVLKTNPSILFEEQKSRFPSDKRSSLTYKVVANLPYYIASPVLRHFLEALVKPQVMVVMMQKEVAEGIVAKSGRMSLLSVSVQLYAEPEIVEYVPAHCFYPAPEVDSAILKITPYTRPVVDIIDTESFFALVRAGFAAPRKQLANSLAKGLGVPKAEVLSLLERVEIEPQRRAETLTLEEWASLLHEYTKTEKKYADADGTG